MIDEGYIKFSCEWSETKPIPEAWMGELNDIRQAVYRLGLIGAYPNGIGYGNISQRFHQDELVISGSATGHLPILTNAHYSHVTGFDIANNRVFCQGAIKASSETMSHAVIYQTCPAINAVIHIHHLEIWKNLLFRVPTTPIGVAYGTPAMAKAIIRLLEDEQLRNVGKTFAMAGHEEGLMVFGTTLAEAMERVCCLVDCGI